MINKLCLSFFLSITSREEGRGILARRKMKVIWTLGEKIIYRRLPSVNTRPRNRTVDGQVYSIWSFVLFTPDEKPNFEIRVVSKTVLCGVNCRRESL